MIVVADGNKSFLSLYRPPDQEEPSVLPLLCAGFSRVRPTALPVLVTLFTADSGLVVLRLFPLEAFH